MYKYKYENLISSKKWEEIKKYSKIYFDNKCWFCNSENNLSIHHLKYTKENTEILKNNKSIFRWLLLVCGECHGKIHAIKECNNITPYKATKLYRDLYFPNKKLSINISIICINNISDKDIKNNFNNCKDEYFENLSDEEKNSLDSAIKESFSRNYKKKGSHDKRIHIPLKVGFKLKNKLYGVQKEVKKYNIPISYYENLAKIYGDRGYKFMNPIYGKNRSRKQTKLS